MKVQRLYCERCQKLTWHQKWEPSSRLIGNLRLYSGLTLGMTLLVLRYLNWRVERSAWRCKLCKDVPLPIAKSKVESQKPIITKYPLPHSATDSRAEEDENRRKQIFSLKPVNCSQAEYWAWHNQLYLGGSSSSPEWLERAWKAKERDNFCCILCGDTQELHTDHIIPLSQGGNNEFENLQTLCKKCHELKTGRPLRSWNKK